MMTSLSISALLYIAIFIALGMGIAAVRKYSKRQPVRATVNPIKEANVYLAYGRKQQALDILKQALLGDPENEECKAKIVEIEKS
jgi:Tfp pilus assembly protein FimV